MMDLGKWSFQNRQLVMFLVAVLLVGGLYASYDMSKLEDPEVKVKLAMVATTYPGARFPSRVSAFLTGLSTPFSTTAMSLSRSWSSSCPWIIMRRMSSTCRNLSETVMRMRWSPLS